MTASYEARLGLYIAGEWLGTEGRETRDVLNPATGQGQAELPLATAADLDRALEASQRGFLAWRATPPEKRAAILTRTAQLLRERGDPIELLLVGRVERPVERPGDRILSERVLGGERIGRASGFVVRIRMRGLGCGCE